MNKWHGWVLSTRLFTLERFRKKAHGCGRGRDILILRLKGFLSVSKDAQTSCKEMAIKRRNTGWVANGWKRSLKMLPEVRCDSTYL